MSEPRYRCERAGIQHAEGLLALFESAGSGCYCNYWHFEGDKNAWLERCYIKPEENRAALVDRLQRPELCGVVALGPDTKVCGWLKLSRASLVPRLYAQKPYRNLPCFQGEPSEREAVFAVGCTYVIETERGYGAATALLASAIAEVKAAGGSALEAFPRGTQGMQSEKLRADEIWMGPEALYLREGFVAVSDFRPYPVLRLHPLPDR